MKFDRFDVEVTIAPMPLHYLSGNALFQSELTTLQQRSDRESASQLTPLTQMRGVVNVDGRDHSRFAIVVKVNKGGVFKLPNGEVLRIAIVIDGEPRYHNPNRELVLTARDEILSHTRVLASLSCGIRVFALDFCDEGVMVLFERNLCKDHANNNADEEDEELGSHPAERHMTEPGQITALTRTIAETNAKSRPVVRLPGGRDAFCKAREKEWEDNFDAPYRFVFYHRSREQIESMHLILIKDTECQLQPPVPTRNAPSEDLEVVTIREDGSDWTPPTVSSDEDRDQSTPPRRPPKKNGKKPKTKKRTSRDILRVDPPRRERLKSLKEIKELKCGSGKIPSIDPPQRSCNAADPNYLTEDDEFFSPFPDVKQDFASAIPNSEKGIPNPARRRKDGPIASHEVCTGRVRRRGEPSSQQTRAENSGTAVVDKGKGMFTGQKSLKLGHNRKNPIVIEDAALDAVELESGQDLTDKINDFSDTIQDLDEEEVRLKLREIELQRQEVALKLQLRRIQKKKQWSGGV
ncbi:uncharacterized protein IWZ02DRAFT_488065 [Phyllosticta citriasiana]|uniref:Uncharacterized protein n=1 Tax=Phyllosticta citriasiana TaxID=595635 RepID=A0ABR1KMK5_9PEZI